MKTFLKILVGLLLAGGLFTFAFYRTPQERAFAKHLRQAQAGKVSAQLAVAQDYLAGQGTQPDAAQAVQWYQQAAAQGNAQAAWELYELYTAGKAAALDEKSAMDYLQIAVQQNVPQAQYELGNLYAQGKSVPQHNGQALYWYLQAAQKGSTAAQAKVGTWATQEAALFEEVNHFVQQQQAAQGGDGQAMLFLAQAYQAGQPLLADEALAVEWLKKAWETSNKTSAPAAFELYRAYDEGKGVEENKETAQEFLAQAAQLSYPPAQYQLGELAYADNPARMEDAFAWFSNAAAQGHSQAQYMTGFMLLQGQGTAKSVPLALRFFEQAAEQENPSAQYVLGQIYFKGAGVKRNPRKGRAWLARAAQNGSEEAQAWLK